MLSDEQRYYDPWWCVSLKILLIIITMAAALVINLGLNDTFASCVSDDDWPGKPCIDTSPPLPLSKSEWKELWSEYSTFKGKEWMEQKKSEMDDQIKADSLKEWIESGFSTQNFSNYNVWFYYHVNDQAPIPEGYDLGTTIRDELLSPLKQFKTGIPTGKIQCKENLQLVVKSINGNPACVKLESLPRLLTQGWDVMNGNSTVDLEAGQQEGSLLVEKVHDNYIEGLNFMKYPVARDEGFPITLKIGESASNGCTVVLTLVKINGDTATFLKNEYNNRPCPICLPENSMIDTPYGNMKIKELKEGMEIFTQDSFGNKVIAVILKTGKTSTPPDHKMIHVVLDDKREVYGSLNHPTSNGVLFGDLSVGDKLDNSTIIELDTTHYDGNFTYDILPSGPTGFYWADEVLVKSTLK